MQGIEQLVHGALVDRPSPSPASTGFEYGLLRSGQLDSSAWSAYAEDVALGLVLTQRVRARVLVAAVASPARRAPATSTRRTATCCRRRPRAPSGQKRCYGDAAADVRRRRQRRPRGRRRRTAAPAGRSASRRSPACGTCNPGATQCEGQTVPPATPRGRPGNADADLRHRPGLRLPRRGVPAALRPGRRRAVQRRLRVLGRRSRQRRRLARRENAAAQQYAIVVSNVQPDVPAHVIVEQDDSSPGDAGARRRRSSPRAVIAPQNLEVFNLGPREVDGSADGTFNTGTGTALTRHAYKVTSDFPIVAYQFNPLDNVERLLERRLAAPARLGPQQRAWGSPTSSRRGRRPSPSPTTRPPTSASTCARSSPSSRRATDTHVDGAARTARVIAGRPVRRRHRRQARTRRRVTLQAFEVLNLETGDFNADFTGSLISADQPVAVFPGSEASDAPDYSTLVGPLLLRRPPGAPDPAPAHGGQVVRPRQDAEPHERGHRRRRRHRRDPGDRVLPRRDRGAPGTTHVTTTLPPPYDAFDLDRPGRLPRPSPRRTTSS